MYRRVWRIEGLDTAIAKLPLPEGYLVDVLTGNIEIGAVARTSCIGAEINHRDGVHHYVNHTAHHQHAVARRVDALYRVLSRRGEKTEVKQRARAIYRTARGYAIQKQLVKHACLGIAQPDVNTRVSRAVVASIGGGDRK